MKINSDYYKTFEEFLAAHPEIDAKQAMAMAPKIQGYEDQMFGFIMFLLF
ncbi:MAG: hypothetical protein KGZ96_02260 [Clostridia bacterium]|jgi:hypothetical protein|nr:hypothetical protein [Clostridia bacterium]